MEPNGDLDQVGSRGHSGKWSDSGYISNMEQPTFAEGLDVGYETERRVKDDANICGLRNWKDEVSIY